jgi:hypothetical protein
MAAKLQMAPKNWYGWQMLPGYGSGFPYFSPIWVQEVIPRKSGRGILGLKFINALYAEGVQDFTLDLRIIRHQASYLVAELLYEGESSRDRTAIISKIELSWIRYLCPELWASRPASDSSGQEDATHYLNTIFQTTGW